MPFQVQLSDNVEKTLTSVSHSKNHCVGIETDRFGINIEFDFSFSTGHPVAEEFAAHEKLKEQLGADVYFAHPYHP